MSNTIHPVFDTSDDATAQRLADLEAEVVALKRKLSELLQSPIVQSPLTVTDTSGKVLVKIGSDLDGGYITIYNNTNQPAITIGCTPTGGFADIHHFDSRTAAVILSAKEDGGMVEITTINQDGSLSYFSYPSE